MLTTTQEQADSRRRSQHYFEISRKAPSFTVRLFNDEAELVTITFKDHNGNVIQTVEEKGGSVASSAPVREDTSPTVD